MTTASPSHTHSVATADLVLTISQASTVLQAQPCILNASEQASLLASIGSLASQADMLCWLEQLSRRTPVEEELLGALRKGATQMVGLTQKALADLQASTSEGAHHV
jgi:hypothetical protein